MRQRAAELCDGDYKNNISAYHYHRRWILETMVPDPSSDAQMSFKPDYGLRLMSQGYGQHVDHNLYDCRLFSLTVLGAGQYSTTVECPIAGQMHALSLDFTERQLEQILSNASSKLTTFLRNEITRDPSTPRTIDFEGEVPFAVRARLGELQQAEYESFVPLVTQEIL